MKKTLQVIMLLTIAFAGVLFARPAKTGVMKYVQPNGQTVSFRLIGDETYHLRKSLDGYTLMFNKNGYLEYAKINVAGGLVCSGVIASDIEKRSSNEVSYLRSIQTNLTYSNKQVRMLKVIENNKRRIQQRKHFVNQDKMNFLMLLVDFTDKAFAISRDEFDNMMNQTNYSGIGSFKDYYIANSYGKLNVTTVVAGWYHAKNNMAYYGANDDYGYDIRPQNLVREAIDSAKAHGINFKQFDNDGDGFVDAVMVIHSGYDEASGADENTIWAHEWSLSGDPNNDQSVPYDGVTLDTYTIQSELEGTTGKVMAGIGGPAHEFGHALGLPDWYDTDYDDPTTGGQAYDLGYWDVMAGGTYNNESKTPANHCAYSKYLLGWLNPTELKADTKVSLPNLNDSSAAYLFQSGVKGEFFLMENRQQIGWDKYIPGHGMLVYHVDSLYIDEHWSSNDVNANPKHQGLDIEEADNDQTATDDYSGTKGTETGDPFPGTKNVTFFGDRTTPNSITWTGVLSHKLISGISETNNVIKFDFALDNKPSVFLVSPVAGSRMTPGKTQNITWSSYLVKKVKIEYSTDNGTNYTKITDSTDATSGSFAWLVPDVSSTTCKIRLTDIASKAPVAVSDAFIIGTLPKIMISEVADNSVYQEEYIELYNADKTAIDLTNWTVSERYNAENTSERTSTLSSSIQKNAKADLILKPGEYAIFVRAELANVDAFITKYAIPDTIAIFKESAGKLPQMNGDERYSLKDNTGVAVDNFGLWEYASSSFRLTKSYCYERMDFDANGELEASWKKTANASYKYTPGAKNASTVAIQDNNVNKIPTHFELKQNYPNPFNPSTKICYNLASRSNVVVKIYNMLGQEVQQLINQEQGAGSYSVSFDAKNLSSGIYICELKAGNFVKRMKMNLIK